MRDIQTTIEQDRCHEKHHLLRKLAFKDGRLKHADDSNQTF